jgi:hypothetical protein
MLVACDDIFETDLSNKTVKLLAPANKIKTKFGTQTFYWEELKGATSYKLQVVTPSFDSIQQFVADTSVLHNNFMLNLTPGSYQWRVIAKNGSSKTDSATIWTVTIDTTTDLQNLKVELDSPKDGFVTNAKKNTFTWKPLPYATGYYFLIGTSDLSGLDGVKVTTTSISLDTLKNGSYNWGVKAFNGTTITGSWITRTILIDTIAPKTPSPIEPKGKVDLTNRTVKFRWTRVEDDGSKLSDCIYISSDSVQLLPSNLSKINYEAKLDTTGIDHTFSADGTYFWTLKTVDAAGNSSIPSTIIGFKIKTN